MESDGLAVVLIENVIITEEAEKEEGKRKEKESLGYTARLRIHNGTLTMNGLLFSRSLVIHSIFFYDNFHNRDGSE